MIINNHDEKYNKFNDYKTAFAQCTRPATATNMW